ncbi:MAG: O-antigen ligase family protein [Ideonella sp.]|jgi:hypothetical protein|nr:O-antigen ligase family protein [Ideonella sp.]
MPEHLRALLVVLVLGTAVFLAAAAQRAGLPVPPEEIARRRNLWLATTLAAFLSGQVWVFFGLLALILLWFRRGDRNPLVLFLVVILSVPPYRVEIPGFLGLNYLFFLDPPRLVALCVLLPAWLVLRTHANSEPFGRLWPDRLLLAYLALNFVTQIGPDSVTNTLREGAFLPFLDVFLPYYVASRSVRNLQAFREVAVAMGVMCMVLAVIAAFESMRGWLLFHALRYALDVDWAYSNYLGRGAGGWLRAQASTGHSIALGYLMVISLCLLAFLRPAMSQPRVVRSTLPATMSSSTFGGRFGPALVGVFIALPLALLSFVRPSSYVPGRPALAPKPTSLPSMAWRLAALTLCVGLVASLSRGPWLGAVVALAVFALTGPDRLTRAAKIGAGAVVAVAVMLSTGVGRQFIDLLPFIGTVDSFNVTYRQRLFDVSMQVFWQHPVFGSFHAKLNPTMESLRQGEGIIDIVNTYLAVALRSGAVGLALFTGVFVLAIAGVVRSLRSIRDGDSDLHVLGRALLAALAGMMVIIVTVSPILAIPLVFWSLAGLGVGYAQMVRRGPHDPFASASGPRRRS